MQAMNSGTSMSTLSNEDKAMAVVLSSEESSSYPDDDDSQLELGLGLSLACGGGGGGKVGNKARILTAKDFDFSNMVLLADKAAVSSSSSCSSVTRANNSNSNGVGSNGGGSCGTKRNAAEPSSPPGRSAPAVNPVVGWPPVKSYRMNSLVNAKLPATEEFTSADDKCKSKNVFEDMNGSRTNDSVKKTSSYVKVNMDGIAIGRKVDLAAHSCYETLARALDDMFRPSAAVGMKGTAIEEQVIVAGTRRPIRLLDGLSEFVLTYEDKDGDLMLVGDVPWEMFFSSVRRLRIMRTAEANGISNIS